MPREPAPHARPGNWPGPRGLPPYPDPVTEPIPVLKPPQGPRSRRKFQLAILGAIATIALVGGAAAAAAGMGFGNVGAPAGACDIPISVMNEAFDSTSFRPGDWSDKYGDRIARGVRCDYVQGASPEADDGVVEVGVLRQEPPDPMHMALLQSASGLSGGVRGERSSIPIIDSSGNGDETGSAYIVCMAGSVLWSVGVQDDPSGISYEGLDIVAEAIGCEPHT